ncbi:hypothetical protein NHX12_011820 [Muraenolepis orangiensis]|uniref:Uncharacterized protein n=1 Tax=Muraenolepis orangiensis TaxID=630683 RepID=A0A9Q0DIJ2_9TELE|nr:hypothetical protein NHX12_011820 [Muraenolepis orangiensis]
MERQEEALEATPDTELKDDQEITVSVEEATGGETVDNAEFEEAMEEGDVEVTELKERLWPMRGFWLSLPHTICNDDKMAADVTNDDRCWNGQTRGRCVCVSVSLSVCVCVCRQRYQCTDVGTESLNYAALEFSGRKTKGRKKNSDRTQESLYSAVRKNCH